MTYSEAVYTNLRLPDDMNHLTTSHDDYARPCIATGSSVDDKKFNVHIQSKNMTMSTTQTP